MIAALTGVVDQLGSEAVVIDVNGVGYLEMTGYARPVGSERGK